MVALVVWCAWRHRPQQYRWVVRSISRRVFEPGVVLAGVLVLAVASGADAAALRPDPAFGGGRVVPVGLAVGLVSGVATQAPDGGVFVAGQDDGGTTAKGFVARLTRGGAVDRRFGGGDGVAALPMQYPREALVTGGRLLVQGGNYQGNHPIETCNQTTSLPTDGTGRPRSRGYCGAPSQTAVDPDGGAWTLVARSSLTVGERAEVLRIGPRGSVVRRNVLFDSFRASDAGLAFDANGLLLATQKRSRLHFARLDRGGRPAQTYGTAMVGIPSRLFVDGARWVVVLDRPRYEGTIRLVFGSFVAGVPVVSGVRRMAAAVRDVTMVDGRLWALLPSAYGPERVRGWSMTGRGPVVRARLPRGGVVTGLAPAGRGLWVVMQRKAGLAVARLEPTATP